MFKLCQMVFSTVLAAVSCLLYPFDKSSSFFEHFLTFWGNRCSKPALHLSCPDPGTSHGSLVLAMESELVEACSLPPGCRCFRVLSADKAGKCELPMESKTSSRRSFRLPRDTADRVHSSLTPFSDSEKPRFYHLLLSPRGSQSPALWPLGPGQAGF